MLYSGAEFECFIQVEFFKKIVTKRRRFFLFQDSSSYSQTSRGRVFLAKTAKKATKKSWTRRSDLSSHHNYHQMRRNERENHKDQHFGWFVWWCWPCTDEELTIIRPNTDVHHHLATHSATVSAHFPAYYPSQHSIAKNEQKPHTKKCFNFAPFHYSWTFR